MLDLLKSVGFTDVTVACPKEVSEMAFAYKQVSPVKEAYQQSELFWRRCALMQDWVDSCLLRCSPA